MKFVLFLIIALLSTTATAWDNNHEIFGGAWSKHLINNPDGDDWNDKGEEWNETHNPIGYRYKQWGLLKFDNSWDKESYAPLYFTKDRFLFNTKIKYDWAIGVSTGYSDVNGTGLMPYIFPRVELIDTKFVEVQLWTTPIVTVLTVSVAF